MASQAPTDLTAAERRQRRDRLTVEYEKSMRELLTPEEWQERWRTSFPPDGGF